MKDAGALLLDLPRSSYDLCEKLSSIGICVPPQEIPLTDGEEDPIRVKLFSDNELGSHLIRVLHETDSLRDAIGINRHRQAAQAACLCHTVLNFNIPLALKFVNGPYKIYAIYPFRGGYDL